MNNHGQTCTILDAGCCTALAGVAVNKEAADKRISVRLEVCDISPDMFQDATKVKNEQK